MKNIIASIIVVIILSCDDGNIDVPEFVFDGSLSICSTPSGSNFNYVLYKTNNNEALSILVSSQNEDFLTTEGNRVIQKTSNKVYYRTFDNTVNGSNYFCQNVPPTEPGLVNEWNGTGDLEITTSFVEDDEDGVSTEIESWNDQDPANNHSDLDGIPDYLDIDDDNDGILTKEEAFDEDGNLRDTDGDGLPDYRDDDDDDDGTPTINESKTADDDEDGIPNYRDPDNKISESARTLTPNVYKEIYESQFTVKVLNLESKNGNTIRFDSYNLGNFTKILDIRQTEQPK